MNKILSFLFFFFIISGIHAQQANYLFHRIGTNEGLAQENPSYASQDNEGYLWVVGNNLVQRYDGHRFRDFYCGRNGNLPAGIIYNALMDEKQNRLWLLIEENFGFFDTKTLKYTSVTISVPGDFTKSQKKMYADRQGNIIIVYKYKGIVTYNRKAHEAATKYNPFTLPDKWGPHTISQDDSQNYWVTCLEGLVKYNSSKKTISYRSHNTDGDPIIASCENEKEMGIVYYDNNKCLWVASFRPVHSFKSFNTVTGEEIQWKGIMDSAAKAFIEIVGMKDCSDGSLWMYGTSFFASVNYKKRTVNFIPQNNPSDHNIRYDLISSLSEDREQSIWVCSNKGLFRFNPPAHLFYSINNRMAGATSTLPVSVTGFLQLHDNKLLVSTWGGGVFGYDNEYTPVVSKFAKGPHNNEGMVWCMLQRKNGDVWKGLQEGHLVIDEANSNKSTFTLLEITNGKTIRQMVEDKSGNIWLGTQQGHLIKWDAAKNTFQTIQQFNRTIIRLIVDNKNSVWACTDNDGVYCINADNGQLIQHYSSTGKPGTTILINSANDVLAYDDTTIVIAANGLNILNTNTGKFKYWDAGAQVFSMLLDSKKNLWASTSMGIICRQLQHEEIQYSYDARDGIGNFSFNTGAAIQLSNGNLAFGTNHEFIVFNPVKAMNFIVGKYDVNISGIFVGDKRLPVDSVLKLPYLSLPHDRNSLTFQFTHNQYQTLQNIYYRLEGKDKDWKQVRSDGELNLNYLSPGEYTLTAAIFNEKMQPAKTLSLRFHIAAPFYKTWWFYTLIGLLLTGMLFWLDRERMKRKEAMQQIRSKIAGQLHQEINSALNNINILSEMAKLKARTEPEKAVEFIDQIHNRSHNMISAMDDMLWSIAPENDSMEKAIERMREYIDALNSRCGIHIEMLVDTKVNTLRPDMQLRHEAFLLFKEGLKNLVESGVISCKIHISTEKNQLLYTLQFSTDTCDVQQLNSKLKRQDMNKRLQSTSATMNMTTHLSNAVLEFKVPVS